MSEVQWEKIVLGPGGFPFRGLWSRYNMSQQDPGYAVELTNFRMRGGAMETRLGLGTLTYPTTVLTQDAGSSDMVLSVLDPFMFRELPPGAPLTVGTRSATLSYVDLFDGTIALQAPLGGFVAAGSAVAYTASDVVYPMPLNTRVACISPGYRPNYPGLSAWLNETPHSVDYGALRPPAMLVPYVTLSSAANNTTVLNVDRTNGVKWDDMITVFVSSTSWLTRRVLSVNHSTLQITISSPGVTLPAGTQLYIYGGSNEPGTWCWHGNTLFYTARRSRRVMCLYGEGDYGTLACAGIRAPDVGSAISVSAVNVTSGAILPGTYQVAIRYYDSYRGIESNESEIRQVVVTPPNNAIRVTLSGANALSPDPRVTNVRIYRSYVDAPGALYYAGMMSHTSGAQATLSNDDSWLGTLMRENVNGVPDGIEVIAEWRSAARLVGAKAYSAVMRYSEPPSVETGLHRGDMWPSRNWIKIGTSDEDDPIIGFAGMRNSLIVLKNRSIWRVTGVPPNVEVRPVYAGKSELRIGPVSAQAYDCDGSRLFVLSEHGIYMFMEDELVDSFSARRLDANVERLIDADYLLSGGLPLPFKRFLTWNPHDRELYVSIGSRAWLVGKLDDTTNEVAWSVYRFGWTGSGYDSSARPLLNAMVLSDDRTVIGQYTLLNGSTVFVGSDNGRVYALYCGVRDYGNIQYESIMRTPVHDINSRETALTRRIDVEYTPAMALNGQMIVGVYGVPEGDRLIASSGFASQPRNWSYPLYNLFPGESIRNHEIMRALTQQMTARTGLYIRKTGDLVFRVSRIAHWIQPITIENTILL